MNSTEIFRHFLHAEMDNEFHSAELNEKALKQFDRLVNLGRSAEFAYRILTQTYASEEETEKKIRTVNGYLIEGFRQMNKGAVNEHTRKQLETLRQTIEKHNARVGKLVGAKIDGHEFTAEDADRVKLSIPRVAMRRERFEAHASIPSHLADKVKGCEVTVSYFR